MPEGYNGAYTGQQIDEGIAKANGALPQSGGVMTGPLSLAGDPAGENEATRKAYVDNVAQTVQSNLTAHTGNTNNPHGVTAEQVGARPNTWTPTAADVGARPDTWLPSATEVGAVPASRKVNGKDLSADIALSAADVGADAAGSAAAVAATLTSHTGNTNNPHSVTAEQVGAAASAHTHSSGDITSGVTNNTSTAGSLSPSTNLITMSTLRHAINRTTSVAVSDSNYTTYMARGTALRSSEATPSYNGQICWVYE